MRNIFDCQKATLFIFSKRVYDEFFSNLPKEKHKYLRTIEYWDSQSVDKTQVLAISRTEKDLCQQLIFPSVIQVQKESMRKPDSIASCIRFHKPDGELSCVLQIEQDNSGNKGPKIRQKGKGQGS